MPVQWTDDMVRDRLARAKLPLDGTPQDRRDRLADWIEATFDDHVEAWEIRTGRPWSTMLAHEAAALIQAHPRLRNNPGVLSRLLSQS